MRCVVSHLSNLGRPKFSIPSESLEDLYGIGLTCKEISEMIGVSRWTIKRRAIETGLQGTCRYDDISQEELDKIAKDYQEKHGPASGETFLSGHIRSLGLRVQRRRVRETLLRVDHRNSAVRWGAVIHRRKYFVPWPNSLWHLDGHHSLIRWKLVIHGCIDGYSRRIMYLQCGDNNLSQSVLDLFLQAINENKGLWPSRVRVDYGVENISVCDAMVEVRGSGRASFIAGPSTHNQRIERLWRDVFRCIAHHFYYVFYGMEDSGLLTVDRAIDMFSLQYTYVPRVNRSLHEFMDAFNHHRLGSCGNRSPYQLWFQGMLNEESPLKDGLLDQDPPNFEIFGIDPDAPSPFDEGNNNVTVEPVSLPVDLHVMRSHLNECINPLKESQDMGIDIYVQVRREIERLLQLPQTEVHSV